MAGTVCAPGSASTAPRGPSELAGKQVSKTEDKLSGNLPIGAPIRSPVGGRRLSRSAVMSVQLDVERVQVGSRVRLQDMDGEAAYSLVRPEEADPFAGLVSSDSPLGRALLGRAPGERVSVRAPGGVRFVTVVAVDSAN